MLGISSRSVTADSSIRFRRSMGLLMAIALPVVSGTLSLVTKPAPAHAEPVVIELGRYGTPIYINGSQVNGAQIYDQPAASISIGSGAVQSVPINYPAYPTYRVYPFYSSGYRHSGYPNRSINNSVLVNPTVINSSIRNSTLINPTIVGAPIYPYPVTNYTTIQTYTRPEPEIVVDPQYGVRYKRPSEY